MKIRVLAVGQKMPAWVEQGVQDYTRRLPPDFRLEIEEIPLGKRWQGCDLNRALQQESDALLARLKGNEKVIALDVQGKSWSSEGLQKEAENWRMQGRDVALLVGGPDGLSPACLARAEQRWSLSALTLPHPLVRVLLAEQIYRAWTLLSGHPYHR